LLNETAQLETAVQPACYCLTVDFKCLQNSKSRSN